MIEHQEHFGRKFYQDKKTGYWISTDSPRVRAHRWVWSHFHGEIPKICHIHHRNEDKSDNSIENLEMLTFAEHAKKHMSDERSKLAAERMNELRPLTKEWHASDEGKAWHRYHAEKNKFGKWEPRTLKCEVCSKKYETTKKSNSHFCSNACRSKWRRDQGLDDVKRQCPTCNAPFEVNKYAKTIYCSKSCAQNRINKIS
jgi:hypothetical protein